jgi:pimeloyl-ACP methyl ester carboxylesterase
VTTPAVRLAPHVLETETGRRIAAESGSIDVPLHHDDPSGPTMAIRFMRLPAWFTRPGPPTVLLAGGPGGAGSEFLTWDDSGWPEFIDGLRAIGDVIALDQRGTGASGPVPLALERWGMPLDRPADRATVVATAIERSHVLRAHWHARGLDTTAYTAAESADDIATLARALGAERVRLFGTSYGSHLGLAVVRRHGDLVDRAALGLVEGPDHTHKLPSVVESAFAHVAAMAAQAPELDGAAPDLVGLARERIAALTADPATVVQVEGPIVVGGFDLQRAVADCMGSQDEIAELPARLTALRHGDATWLARLARERRTAWFPDAMYLHTDAASGATAARRARIAEEAATSLLGDAINLPFPDVEAAWGYPDLGDDFRGPIASEVPVQFYSGVLDGRTPQSNVEELIGGFRTAGHLLVDGLAHDDGLISPQVRTRLLRFLAGDEPATGGEAIPFRFSAIAR